MKHSQCYFTNTRIILYVLFLCMIPTGANAQLFGGMMKASKNITIIDIGIPANITLGQNARYFVASINDNDYLPYTIPTGPATTAKLDADGAPDTPINLQGTIPTTGITVSIPATATGSGAIPAYSVTVSVPASVTEDGIARDLTLSWTAQEYTTTTEYIIATINAVGGTLNAKKLDINAGIGSDNLGILLGNLVYPYNNAGTTSNFAVREMPGIPDRMFGLADNGGIVRHNFLYLPVTGEDGKLWLSNNLGADYANVNSPAFNPAKQATSPTDSLAYGSLFEWGRKPDGHELVNWTTKAISDFTADKSNAPTHDKFICISPDWQVTRRYNLWSNENSVNNPCPIGWRLPNRDNFTPIWGDLAKVDYLAVLRSKMKFTHGGMRWGSPSCGSIRSLNGEGWYWSSEVVGPKSYLWRITASWASIFFKGECIIGGSVRCVKPTNP